MKKVTTSDCINYLMNNIQGENWKRVSKRGTGDNIIRGFRNQNGDVVFVRSSETVIFGICSEDIITSNKPNIKFKDLLKWVDENEENPINDGPYIFEPEEEKTFVSEFIKGFNNDFLDAIIAYNSLSNVDELYLEHFSADVNEIADFTGFDVQIHFSIDDDDLQEEYMKIIFLRFVDTLNTLNYANKFKI